MSIKTNYISNIILFVRGIRKKNQVINFLFILIRRLPILFTKGINSFQMFLIFMINPQILYKYSLRDCLPTEYMRDKSNSNIFTIYQPKVECNFGISKKRRTLYAKGFSGHINNSRETFLINFKVTNMNKKSTFITTDIIWHQYYLQQGVEVIYIKVNFVNDNGHVKTLNPRKSSGKDCKEINLSMKTNINLEHYPIGSAIPSIISLYLLSSDLSVFGWNCYINKKLSNMNIIEFLFRNFYFGFYYFLMRDRIVKDQVELHLIHLFFAYYLQGIQNLKIFGNIDYYKNRRLDKFMTYRLNKIFLHHNTN